MESKRKLSNEIVWLQVLQVFVVVRVKDLDFESVLLLKLKVYCNFSNKLRIQVVMNDFSLPDSLPHSALHNKKDTEGVTFWKCVHISQFFARKA